jgi:hypothetical protein
LRGLHVALSNRQPPTDLANRQDFVQFLARKQFRGAMTLEKVRLQFDTSGKAQAILFEEDEHVGYTPYPFYGGNRYRRGLMGIPEATTALVTGNRGTITKTFRFRLDEWGDRFGHALLGSRAPDAWIGLKYDIWSDGKFRVEFSGSFIPSQWYYPGWSVQGEHDMGNNSTAETLGFFHAGAAARSPGQLHFRFP